MLVLVVVVKKGGIILQLLEAEGVELVATTSSRNSSRNYIGVYFYFPIIKFFAIICRSIEGFYFPSYMAAEKVKAIIGTS